MTTALWCWHCKKRCGDANLVDGRYVQVVSAAQPVVSDTRPTQRRPPGMIRDRTDRDTPPAGWPCPACGRQVWLDYGLLQRVGRDRNITTASMPTAS
jgi:hypothetical protein